MRKATALAFGFLILGLAGAVRLAAQVDTGTISGVVRDASGAVVPQAKVTIRNTGTDQVQTVVSDSQGLYVSLPLYTGRYSVSVQLAGFDNLIKRVDLNVAQRVEVNFDLQVASAAQAVDVQTTGAPLQTESETSTLSNLRTETEVKNLPLNGRNFAQLMGLAAGVMPAESEMTGNNPIIVKRGVTAYSMSGLRLEENQFLIDGIYDNDNHNGLGILLFPPLDAIDEFREETSVADARFGRGGGGTANIIFKSGTNQFHGDLFEFLRNSALDARNFFDKRIPEFRMNQFGATLGGPVIPRKDARTFFFVDYQGTRTRQGQSLVDSVPTAAERNGDFSAFSQVIYNPLTQTPSATGTFQRQPFPGNQIPASMIDGVGRNLMNLYPLPNQAGTANNYLYGAARAITENSFDGKVNHTFSNSDSAWARYSHSFFNIYEPGQLPPPAVGGGPPSGPNYQTADQAILSETHIFSPRAVNQARFGFTRLNDQSHNIDYGQNLASDAGIPGVNVPGNIQTTGLPLINITGLTPLGENGFSPAVIVSNNFQWNDDITYIRGKHALSFGAQFLRIQYNVFQSTSERGSITFSTGYSSNPASTGATGLGAADLLLGRPISGSLIYVPGLIGMRQSDAAAYIQDDYKATSNLTINMGLRYENFLGWPYEEVKDRMYQFVPATASLVQVGTNGIPRSGHYGNNKQFAPRIGLAYKLPHDTVIRAAYGIFYSAPQVASTYDINFNPPETISTAFTNNQFDFGNARPVSAGFNRSAVSGSASLVYLDPHAKTPTTQQWNATIAHQLPGSILLTAAYVGSKGTWLNSYPDINQPIPGLTPIASRRPFPTYQTIYGLENIDNSSYNGLQLSLARRMGNGLNFQISYTYSHAIDYASGNISTPMNSYNIRQDRGSADFNVPHRFVGSWTYLLPFQASGVLKQVVQGWQLNGILGLYSGLPFSVGSATNTLNNGYSTRANRICDGSLSNPTVADWFDLSCFTTPGPQQWGNGGRNILRGPGTKQLDVSVFKDFPLGSDSSRYLQFRSEFFNVLNIPQFNNPSSTFGAPGAGTVTSAGSPRTLQRISREIQFALKLYW